MPFKVQIRFQNVKKNVEGIEQKRFFLTLKVTQIKITLTFHFVTFRNTVALVALQRL